MYSHILLGRQGLTSLLLLLVLYCQLSLCLAQEEEDQPEAVFQPAYDRALDRGSSGPYPTQHFYSSKLKVPRFNYLKWTPGCATKNDFYFITPKGWKVPNPGPMVLDYRGELVWADHFDNEFGGQAYDLMVQEYLGEKFLTFWLGDDRIRGHGAGHFHMINPAYDTIHRIGAANGRSADLHEFRLTPQGTALIVIFEATSFDVRPAGRDFDDVWNQYIWDCLIQEVDIKTGDLIFEWRASEHLDITDSFHTITDRSEGLPDRPYDPFHFNSVDKDELGNYLVSARYTHAVYYISGTTNEVIWTLGGKNNSFMDLSSETALNFAWQHDARFVQPDAFPETYTPPPAKEGTTTKLLTLFDNAAEDWHYQYGPPNARGLLLELTYPTNSIASPRKEDSEKPANTQTSARSTILSSLDATKVSSINGTNPAYTVRLIQQYTNPSSTSRASSQGSMQLVSTNEPNKDPHILLGHGINAAITEYSSNGTLLCDIHFAAASTWEKGDVQSYRALKFPDWVGRPHVPPDVAVHGHDVYVSWNGATGVHEWLLQTWEGDADDHWKAAKIVKKAGFETRLEIPKDRRGSKFLRVTALDFNGHPCEYGVSEAYEKGLLYGRKKAREHSFLRSVGWVLGGGGAVFLLARFLRRCWNLRQRRRYGKWRLP